MLWRADDTRKQCSPCHWYDGSVPGVRLSLLSFCKNRTSITVVERGFHGVKMCFKIKVHVWKKFQFFSFILEKYKWILSPYVFIRYSIFFIHSFITISGITVKSDHLSDFGAENTIVIGKNLLHDREGDLRGNPSGNACLGTKQHAIVSAVIILNPL